MSVFDLAKQNVSLLEAAERYGMDVNRHGKALCPFHDDHHPSLYVADDHYYCFACGEHGDVIDFVSKLLQIPVYDAALRLIADFGLDPKLAAKENSSPRRSIVAQLKRKRESEDRCFADLNGYVWVLRDWQKRYAPTAPDAEMDAHFIEACQRLPYADYLTENWLLGDADEREAIRTGEPYKIIKSRMAQIRLEEKENERNAPVAG